MIKKLYTSNGIEILVHERHVERLSKFIWLYNGRIYRQKIVGCYHQQWPIANEVLQIDRTILVDHKDRNPFNNYDENLRVATILQNAANKRKRVNAISSKHKGVSNSRLRGVWRARIQVNYKQINLGHFKTELEAAIAYNEAAVKYFGEFAVLNIVR